MRAVFAVALCFVLGACAGDPEPYGIFDAVLANGESLPTEDVTGAWLELRSDGTSVLTITYPGQAEPGVFPGTFDLGEFTDGCRTFTNKDDEGPEVMSGSICGDELTADAWGNAVVLHKRH